MATVTLCNYEYPPNCGGGGVFTADLAHELRARDHEVRVVADERDQATESLSSMLSWPLRSFLSVAVNATDSDVLNGHFAVPSSASLPPVSALADVPLVVNLMGADIHDPTRYSHVRPLLDAALEHWIGRYAEALVVPSLDMYDRVPESLQPRTRTIPYFVDPHRFSPPDDAPTGPPYHLLTVARLVERKRLDRALRAVRKLVDWGRDVRYTIAGSGPMADELRNLRGELDLDDRVTFAGYVDDDELPALYRDHDVFVLPSAHEAFGIAAVEAMASGCPVVATETGGHAEVAGPPGVQVGPRPPSIADGIADVLGRLPERSVAARHRVLQRYVPSAVIPQYEDLYREVGNE